MAIDRSTLHGSTDILRNDDPVRVYLHEGYHPDDAFDGDVTKINGVECSIHRWEYKFRYTVHRQYVGFFTPMIMDVSYDVAVQENNNRVTFEQVVEPFVEGALFMNHTSSFIVEFLKGQQFGYNRKSLYDDIHSRVGHNGEVWYADWGTPPLTVQNQRIFVYDLDNDNHGSMLDPANAVSFTVRRWELEQPYVHARTGKLPMTILSASIVAGYTEPVAVHPRR